MWAMLTMNQVLKNTVALCRDSFAFMILLIIFQQQKVPPDLQIFLRIAIKINLQREEFQ